MPIIRIEKVTIPVMRKLLRRGGILELETVLLDGKEAWRAQVRMPDQPETIHRLMVYHTADTKYFKSLTTAFRFYCEEVRGAKTFTVLAEPVEEITTDE